MIWSRTLRSSARTSPITSSASSSRLNLSLTDRLYERFSLNATDADLDDQIQRTARQIARIQSIQRSLENPDLLPSTRRHLVDALSRIWATEGDTSPSVSMEHLSLAEATHNSAVDEIADRIDDPVINSLRLSLQNSLVTPEVRQVLRRTIMERIQRFQDLYGEFNLNELPSEFSREMVQEVLPQARDGHSSIFDELTNSRVRSLQASLENPLLSTHVRRALQAALERFLLPNMDVNDEELLPAYTSLLPPPYTNGELVLPLYGTVMGQSQ